MSPSAKKNDVSRSIALPDMLENNNLFPTRKQRLLQPTITLLSKKKLLQKSFASGRDQGEFPEKRG